MGILKMVFTFLIIVVALFFAWRSTRKARSGDLTSTIDLRELEAVRQELRDLVPGAAGMALPSGAAGSDKALMPGTAGPVQEVWNLDPIPVSRTAALATQMETEISELVEQQPEDVAVLLRSWLSERRTARRN
jgi:flagellar biosynthesis/type III secretory pathway M-ring protein FliF/YscJ